LKIKKYLKKFIVLLSLLPFSIPTFGQTVEQTLAFAHARFQEQEYTIASKAYQRVLYYEKEKYNFEVYHKLGKAYFDLEDFDKSSYYYELAYNVADDDSLKNHLMFNKISCKLFKHDFQMALMQLLGMDDNLSGYFNKKRIFYLGVTYFGLEQFDKSKMHFQKIIGDDSNLLAELDELFVSNNKINKIKPNLAKVLSMFLPGLGQVYAGNITSGLNSLVLTSSFIAIGAGITLVYTPLDALVAILPWFQRYYTGGYNNAEVIAQDKIKKKRSLVYQEIVELVEDELN